MGKPKTPEPPDPMQTAQAQTGANISTAQANAILGNVNQVTPYGNLTYTQSGQKFVNDSNGSTWYVGPNGEYSQSKPGLVPIYSTTPASKPVYGGTPNQHGGSVNIRSGAQPGTAATQSVSGYTLPKGYKEVKGYYIPQYTATQTLSPSQQKIFDETQGASLNLAKLANNQSGRLDELLSKPFSLEDSGLTRDRVEQALMDRLNPQLQQDEDRLLTRLSNQGIKLGSTAFDTGMDEATRQRNDARLAVIAQAGDEQTRAAQLQFAARNQPINEILALASGSQVQQPNFVNSNMPNIPTTDVAGLINENFNQKMGVYNAKSAAANSMAGGIGGLFGSLLSLSDRRAKTDIKKVGKTGDGQNIYSYRYKGEGKNTPLRMGLMAQEVEKRNPDAVATLPSGLKAVNYTMALGAA